MYIQHYIFESCMIEDVEGNKLELPPGGAFVSYVENSETVVVAFQVRSPSQRQDIKIAQSELRRLGSVDN